MQVTKNDLCIKKSQVALRVMRDAWQWRCLRGLLVLHMVLKDNRPAYVVWYEM